MTTTIAGFPGLSLEALGLLMPMFLWVNRDGDRGRQKFRIENIQADRRAAAAGQLQAIAAFAAAMLAHNV